jgi:hypothetical protein
MMVDTLAPAYNTDTVLSRVEAKWNLSRGLPLPRWNITCLCGAQAESGGIQIRYWQFARQDGKSHPWRCNVSTKCTVCSKVETYGLVVSQAYYEARNGKHYIPWREGIRELQ